MGKVWNFERFASASAFVDDKGTTISYKELLSLQESVGRTFDKRCLVMMLTANTVGAVCSYAAFLNSGLPIILVSVKTPEDMLRQLMKSYKPAVLLLPQEMRGNFPFMKEKLRIYDYTALLTNYPDEYPIHEELGLLLTTSGSTGSVKFVRQSFENIVFNAGSFVRCLDMTASDRTITVLPMHYTYGLSVINASLLAGACMIITEMSPLEENFWDFFEEQRVTAIHAVSNTYDMLRRVEIFEEEFPNLRLIAQGGGKLSVDLHDYLARYALKTGKTFVALYGQCEATALISYLPFSRTVEKEGSVGIPVQGGRVTLKDEQGNTITEANVQGEICYEGPNVAMGYALCRDDLAKGFEWNGAIRTGDLAYMDAEGYTYITGRLKRYIKMFGHRISLDEIDDIIMESVHIRSVSSGTDDHLVVFVTGESEKETVVDFIAKRFPAVRMGVQVKVLDEFPRNESGKIRYAELFDMAKEIGKG